MRLPPPIGSENWLGLQADAFPGIMYARVFHLGTPAPPGLVRGLRLGFEATQIRKLLYDTDLASVARPVLEASAVARGRAIFFDRVVGDIINQQILVDVPPVYAGAMIEPQLLAPVDETRPLAARRRVRPWGQQWAALRQGRLHPRMYQDSLLR